MCMDKKGSNQAEIGPSDDEKRFKKTGPKLKTWLVSTKKKLNLKVYTGFPRGPTHCYSLLTSKSMAVTSHPIFEEGRKVWNGQKKKFTTLKKRSFKFQKMDTGEQQPYGSTLVNNTVDYLDLKYRRFSIEIKQACVDLFELNIEDV